MEVNKLKWLSLKFSDEVPVRPDRRQAARTVQPGGVVRRLGDDDRGQRRVSHFLTRLNEWLVIVFLPPAHTSH